MTFLRKEVLVLLVALTQWRRLMLWLRLWLLLLLLRCAWVPGHQAPAAMSRLSA